MSAQIHTLKTGDLSKNKPAKKKVELIDALIHNVFNRLLFVANKMYFEVILAIRHMPEGKMSFDIGYATRDHGRIRNPV